MIPKLHPACAIFPPIDSDDLEELVESISENGQREECVTIGGLLLDGRNRWTAAEIAGKKPLTREFDPTTDGPSPLRFVLDANLNRRHLTPSQRAAAAAAAIPLFETEARARAVGAGEIQETEIPEVKTKTVPYLFDEAKEKAASKWKGDDPEIEEPAPAPAPKQTPTQEAAETFGASERSAERAKALKKTRPDLFEKVTEGTITVSAAEKQAKKEAEEAEAKGEREPLLEKIRGNIGAGSLTKEFVDAIERSTILKKPADLKDFASLSIDRQVAVAPLIAEGWSFSQAVSYTDYEPDVKTTVGDMINVAIAKGAETYEFSHNGWHFTVSKKEETE